MAWTPNKHSACIYKKNACKFTNISETWIICKLFSNVWNRLFPSSSHTLQPLTRISKTLSASGDAKYRHIYIAKTANRIPAAKRLQKQCGLQCAILENNSFLDMSPLMWQKLDVISCNRQRTWQERRGPPSCIWTIIHS